MANPGLGRSCPTTGLSVPECSCKGCLEVMLMEFSPELISSEIRVTRIRPEQRSEPGDHRKAA